MPVTPALQQSYDYLKGMKETLDQAEAHMRVLRAIDHPQAVKLASDLATAKQKREQLLGAIETEMNRA